VESNGRVNLDKIATYFQELDAYQEARNDMNARYIEWQLAHTKCKTDRGSCKCAPEPTGRAKCPVLEDYITDETETCPLSNVIGHPCRDRRPYSIEGGGWAGERSRSDRLANGLALSFPLEPLHIFSAESVWDTGRWAKSPEFGANILEMILKILRCNFNHVLIFVEGLPSDLS
jgi:hypothetical protein